MRLSSLFSSSDFTILFCFLGFVLIFYGAREYIHIRKAKTGKDKKMIEDFLRAVVPDPENYTLAYAGWKRKEYRIVKTTTIYWYYAIAFNSDRIYVVPLSEENGVIEAHEGDCFHKWELGMINSSKGSNWMTLYSKNKLEYVTLQVKARNLQDSEFHIVNILQPEAEKKYKELVNLWLKEINEANGIQVTGIDQHPLGPFL